MTALLQCGHMFCNDCWRRHLQIQIDDEGQVSFSPLLPCDGRLSGVCLFGIWRLFSSSCSRHMLPPRLFHFARSLNAAGAEQAARMSCPGETVMQGRKSGRCNIIVDERVVEGLLEGGEDRRLLAKCRPLAFQGLC